MNDGTRPQPESGDAPPQIPGLPQTEQAASQDSSLDPQAWAEFEFLSRNASPDELEQDANRREHDRNQRFRHHFELIAIGSLYVAAIAIAGVGSVWLWHMAAPLQLRWLGAEDVSHLQSIMTAGLLVGVIGNHFKKRLAALIRDDVVLREINRWRQRAFEQAECLRCVYFIAWDREACGCDGGARTFSGTAALAMSGRA